MNLLNLFLFKDSIDLSKLESLGIVGLETLKRKVGGLWAGGIQGRVPLLALANDQTIPEN